MASLSGRLPARLRLRFLALFSSCWYGHCCSYEQELFVGQVVGLKTLLAKAVGIVFSVSAGLPCGKASRVVFSSLAG